MIKTLALVLLLACVAAQAQPGTADIDARRQALLAEIERDLLYITASRPELAVPQQVLAVIGRTPRHLFIPEASRDEAYENRPVPIGYGQTISQPLIVAIMTALLDPEPGDRVFELGTGSGYQAAVLSPLVAEVYSMEIIPELGERATNVLDRLGYHNVHVRVGDGYTGWPGAAPFDGVIVTAAGDHVPPPLLQQLKPGGRMVIPVGGRFFSQQLVLVEKAADGTFETRNLLPVSFVPLTGGH